MGSSYRNLLLEIAEDLTPKILEDLKFLCLDDIGEGELEQISSPLKLFKALERRELLGINDLSFLQDLLTNVKCIQLANKVKDFTLRRELELLGLNEQRVKLKERCSRCVQTRRFPCEEDDPGSRFHMALAVCKCNSGKEDLEEMHSTCSSCICSNHHSKARIPAELYLKVFLKLASKGAWFAGTAFILKRYINDPETLVKLFASVVLPSGIVLKYLCEGSVLCVLEASDLQGLYTLWQNYEDGSLKKALEEILITEDLKKISEGQEIILDVDLDREMYQNACLDLISIKEKVNELYDVVEQRPRSVSDPTHGLPGKLVNTFQEESFHLMATTEKKRRLHAEKQLDKLKSGQSLELRFPELLQLDTDKNSEDVSGDDSSSTTSTLDEEDLLNWEDENKPSNEFWKSIKGGFKEKPWTDFEDVIIKGFPDELEQGGIPLLKFLAYVLRVNYDRRTSENVSLGNFIRTSKCFGPFVKGSQGCLSKMVDLMESSASLSPDGEKTSWFAGYMTESEAKQKLLNHEGGAFLVRFNTSMVSPGFVLSTKSHSNDFVEYNIEVHRESGKVEIGDSVFDSLPYLVAELRKSWMKDLQPITHS